MSLRGVRDEAIPSLISSIQVAELLLSLYIESNYTGRLAF